jgi:hypothetical protein
MMLVEFGVVSFDLATFRRRSLPKNLMWLEEISQFEISKIIIQQNIISQNISVFGVRAGDVY